MTTSPTLVHEPTHPSRCSPERVDAVRHAVVDRRLSCRATILGVLLSLRLGEWISGAYATMAARCAEAPDCCPGRGTPRERLALLLVDQVRYEMRTRLALVELSELFVVDAPRVGLEPEIDPWRATLRDYSRDYARDYARVLDVQLHERVEALCARHPVGSGDADEVWSELVERRQVDACVGVLLARAAMLAARPQPGLLGRVDDMATGCVGSFAWWCCWYLDACGDDYPLGERLGDGDVDAFMSAVRLTLEDLDEGLLAALLRVFPAIAP